MPFTENFAELRFGGPAWGIQESWSCGLKLKHLGGDAPAAMDEEIQATYPAVVSLVQDYYTDGNASFNGGTRLEWIRFNVISAATGKYYYPNNPRTFYFDNPIANGFPVGVPQVAYAVTLRGTVRRGPGSRGRWYVPVATGASPVTTTGVMPENVAQAFSDAAGEFLSALATIDSGLGPDAWMPWLYGDGIGGPVDSAVSSVWVGNVYDTQQRRRRQIEETYIESTTFDPVNG